MYVYAVMPIDWWEGWMNFREFMGRISYEEMPRAVQRFERAKEIAKERLGWEGDFREGPFVAGLPPVPGDAGLALRAAVGREARG